MGKPKQAAFSRKDAVTHGSHTNYPDGGIASCEESAAYLRNLISSSFFSSSPMILEVVTLTSTPSMTNFLVRFRVLLEKFCKKGQRTEGGRVTSRLKHEGGYFSILVEKWLEKKKKNVFESTVWEYNQI